MSNVWLSIMFTFHSADDCGTVAQSLKKNTFLIYVSIFPFSWRFLMIYGDAAKVANVH